MKKSPNYIQAFFFFRSKLWTILLNTDCGPFLLNYNTVPKLSSKVECHPLECRNVYLIRSLYLEQPSVSTCSILFNGYASRTADRHGPRGHLSCSELIIKFLITFHLSDSLLRCVFSVPCGLYFYALVTSEHKVHEHLVKTEESLLSALPVVYISVPL